MLRMRLTNEKAGYNPLYPEAEGQTTADKVKLMGLVDTWGRIRSA